MRTGKSVQFKTVEDILSAYESRDVVKFAIFQDKQFLFKYEGEDINEGLIQLETMIRALRQSAAIYTLAVYEDIPKNGKIKSDTPYDGSFNFRFQDNTDSYNNGSSLLRELTENQRVMNERINAILEKENDEPENEPSEMDAISGFLSHPLVQQYAPVLLGALGVKMGEPPAAAMAGLPAAGCHNQDISDELYSALCDMLNVSPDVEKHLIKLGTLAKTNPAKFKQILGYTNFI